MAHDDKTVDGIGGHILDGNQLVAAALPQKPFHIYPWLLQQGSALVYGDRGVGKTVLLTHLALAAVMGMEFLWWEIVLRTRVLYIGYDHSLASLKKKIVWAQNVLTDERDRRNLNVIAGLKKPILYRPSKTAMQDLLFKSFSEEIFDRDKQNMMINLQNYDLRSKGINLVVIDDSSLFHLHDSDTPDWQQAVSVIKELQSQGAAVIVCHHASPSEAPPWKMDCSSYDTVIHLKKPDDYCQAQYPRFQVHFEWARGLPDKKATSFETQLVRWFPWEKEAIWRYMGFY